MFVMLLAFTLQLHIGVFSGVFQNFEFVLFGGSCSVTDTVGLILRSFWTVGA